MKKSVLIFTMTVAAFLSNAQTGQTYTQMFDSLFSNVPYTVVSGILYDRVADIQLNCVSLQKIKCLTHKIKIS